jgi:hypothetical protein
VYVAILGLSVLVAVIGLGGIALSRAQARARDLQADTAEARGYAMAAVELARTMIKADSSWRTNRSNGAWVTNQAFGNGKISVDVTDPAGPLGDDDTRPVVVTGTGMKGQAVQKVQVTLGAVLTPYTCMETSAISGGIMTLNNTTVSGAGSVISSNVAMSALTGNVYPDAETVATVLGGTFWGNTTSLAAARTMPPSTVFDYYTTNGTAITYASLPVAGGNAVIQNCVLSPQSNPFGTTNGKGIYVVNCSGQDVTITNCRIVGTLVLLNAGTVVIQGSVTWEPGVVNFPCLMVQGSVTLKAGKADLAEGGPKGNLNPSGTPYPYLSGGTTNTNSTDKYPSVIDGLVYVSGNLTSQTDPAVDNLIVGGAWTATGTMTLSPKAIYQTNPPPGFRTVEMSVVSGTWKQVVN